MQDLTFGEQVKIILSRKDMTIKELARKVEARTGKKMSRQNLTQRLGRDNFQERDMRMIAEILGCPFQLNILDERTITESETQAGQSAGVEAGAAGAAGQPAKKELAESAAEKEKPKETRGRAHERDITIGELVDIHEELDALMQKAAGEAPEEREPAAKPDEIQKDEGAGEERDFASDGEDNKVQADERDNGNARNKEDGGQPQGNEADHSGERPREIEPGHMEGHPQENGASQDGERPQEDKAGYPDEKAGDNLAGYQGGQIHEETQAKQEEFTQGHTVIQAPAGAEGLRPIRYTQGHTVIQAPAGAEGLRPIRYTQGHTAIQAPAGAEGLRPSMYESETQAGYPGENEEADAAEYLGGPESGQVEELLQEIETLEKTEKKEPVQEEKPHGWRAYLKQRFKKLGKEQPQAEKAASDINREQNVDKQIQKESENAVYEGMVNEAAYEPSHFSGEFSVESYGEESREGEYLNVGYPGETYPEDASWEGEEDKGDLNPYTGKEYETNSVRMHPSRIGYVQVYDRANHQWTDMTEWAFLGYQERKKQLLGKDYDPPIYLD